MKHYDFEISLFVDGELTGNSKDELFVHLSKCRECRDAFSNYLLLKEKSREFCSQQIDGVENNKMEKNLVHKAYFYTSAAAAVILAALLIGIKLQPAYKAKTYVKIDSVFVVPPKIEIPGHNPKAQASLNYVNKKIPKQLSGSKLIESVLNMPSEKITDADLIKQHDGSFQ
jgi:hypothetical protein